MTTQEDIANINAYRRLAQVCQDLESELGCQGFVDDLYSETKGYAHLWAMDYEAIKEWARPILERLIREWEETA